jgi:hypothetical protein
MQEEPSVDTQNPSLEYIAGPIEVHSWADGVFGDDTAAKVNGL